MSFMDNNIFFKVPADPFARWNEGKTFTLRQLQTAVINNSNITGVVKELGLSNSGPVNRFVRHKMLEHSVHQHGKALADWGRDWRPLYSKKHEDRKPVKTYITNTSDSGKVSTATRTFSKPTEVDKIKLEEAGRLILEALGEDVGRDGLKDTPKRFANYYADIMNGHFLKADDYVTDFENDGAYNGPVVVTNMPFYTICEHHLAPFIGTWDFAYQPQDRILGLSKIVRIARVHQKRPQVQERLTQQIAESMMQILEPKWVVVRMGAEHFCMSTRGVRTPGAKTYTRANLAPRRTSRGAYSTGMNKSILPIPQGEV